MMPKFYLINHNAFILIFFLFYYAPVYAQNTSMTPEQVRQLVENLMQGKSDEIAKMNQRINELEKLTEAQKKIIQQLQTSQSPTQVPENNASTEDISPTFLEQSQQSLATFFFPNNNRVEENSNSSLNENKGPEISGFFSTTAQTTNGTNQPFHVGVVELDLDRILHKGDFAASIALDWFPYGTTPSVQLGAAFVDFHLYDERIPVRGRIFQDPGFHLQVGQFDLPFGSDYQYFAVTDRFTITPPMTTTRIQQSGVNSSNGGFNSPGIRTYGKWQDITYAAYVVNSIFSNGMAVGGRLGYSVTTPFQLHSRSDLPLVDFGVSYIEDMDHVEQTTDRLYALDFSFNYQNFRLNSEFVQHYSNRHRNDGNPVLNELAFHITLMTDLQQWVHEDVYVYGRYQEWRPSYSTVTIDNANFQVGFIPAFTVGMGYHFNDYLTVKFEYTDTFGHQTTEPTFQSQTAIAQLVGSF